MTVSSPDTFTGAPTLNDVRISQPKFWHCDQGQDLETSDPRATCGCPKYTDVASSA